MSNDSDLSTSILFWFLALNDLVKERSPSFILFTVLVFYCVYIKSL